MNLHPSVLLALLGALLLTQCGEASNNRCGETTSSQFECGSDAACVWAGDEGSECRPKCESYDECASGEYCGPRAVPTSDAELLSANVCLPNALIELPQSQAEIEEFERACRARDLDDCERDPRCQWEYAEKLNLEAQCREPTPVGCKAPLTLCTLSILVSENSLGELFIFAMGCGNELYTPLYLEFDTPLYELLFGGETEVYDWPRCN